MESAYVKNCDGRCSQLHSDDDYGECVVVMNVSPIKGTAQVEFKVAEGTEPTLSIPMLVANGNRVVHCGEDVMLSTAGGEVAPLTYVGDECCLKVLINNSIEIMVDVWTPCHVCPPSWVRCLNPESVEKRTTSTSTKVPISTGPGDQEMMTSADIQRSTSQGSNQSQAFPENSLIPEQTVAEDEVERFYAKMKQKFD